MSICNYKFIIFSKLFAVTNKNYLKFVYFLLTSKAPPPLGNNLNFLKGKSKTTWAFTCDLNASVEKFRRSWAKNTVSIKDMG